MFQCKVNWLGLNVLFLQSASVTCTKALPSGGLWAAASLPKHQEQAAGARCHCRQQAKAWLHSRHHQPSQHVLASWVEAYHRTFPELPGMKMRGAVNCFGIPLHIFYIFYVFCLSPLHCDLWGLDGCSCSASALPVQPLWPQQLTTDPEIFFPIPPPPPPSPSTQPPSPDSVAHLITPQRVLVKMSQTGPHYLNSKAHLSDLLKPKWVRENAIRSWSKGNIFW